MRRKYSDEERQAVINLRTQGIKLDDIAIQLDIPFIQVRKMLNKAGVVLSHEQRSILATDVRSKTATQYPIGTTERILELQKLGKTRQEIADELNIDIMKVKSDIQRFSTYKLTDEQRRNIQRTYSDEQYQEVVNLRKSGMKLQDIASRTGMSSGTIEKYLVINNIQPLVPVVLKYSSSDRETVINTRQNTPTVTLKEMAAQTGLHRSYIKKVLWEEGVVIDPQQRQANSLRANLDKNPNHISHMRSGLTEESFSKQGESIKKFYESHPERIQEISENSKNWWNNLSDDERKNHGYNTAMSLKSSINWQTHLKNLSEIPKELNPKTILSFQENGVSSYKELMDKYALGNEGKYLGGYLSVSDKCQWLCKFGHEFSMRPYNVRDGQWCNICARSAVSKECRQVVDFIVGKLPYKNLRWTDDQKLKMVGTDNDGKVSVRIILNDRTKIKPKELDIYLPDFNLAIEYCGIYYHSEGFDENKNPKTAHYEKYLAAQQAGIRLITVISDEWKFRKEQVEGYLTAILGAKGEKYHARKLEVKEGDSKVVEGFIEKYHIQGAASGVGYTLCDDSGDIIAAATFSKRNEKYSSSDNEYTLNRYCIKPNCNVPGGLGRLMSAFVDKYKPSKIVSFSDRRWSSGNLYKGLGFTLTGAIAPDYMYFWNNSPGPRIHKFNFRRKKLIAMGADPALTEWPMAQSVGLNRIWDCGKDRWELTF